ncbi:MAG: NNP family nitrate/nitrite transporter-like MFS transporter [Oceanicoccus sp.]|jgi:NNP family nitrate/nitrite transporter-like MFS transporter
MKNESKLALTVATIAFAANFSVWTLYIVLGIHLEPLLDLSATQYAILVSSPIMTGALLRWPAGFLCEYFSSRNLFIIQMMLTIPPLLLLNYAHSFNDFLAVGFLIGISGVSFTLGIEYVSQWFNRNQQGMAMGIFGAGNAGAAITLLIAPALIDQFGLKYIGPIFAFGMMVILLLFIFLAPRKPMLRKIGKQPLSFYLSPLKQMTVWRFALYYYFVFGSFLALLLWLPLYYVNAYNLTPKEAMSWTLVFALSSSLVRALGGWYSDQYGGRTVNWWVFWICIICLFFLSYPPTTMVIHGVERDVNVSIKVSLTVFNILIVIIGLAQGFGRASVYKMIHDYYPEQMGSVGGTVAMLGGIGGFTLPVIFGVGVDLLGVYSASFMLLYGVVAACMITMYLAFKADKYERRMQSALKNEFLKKIQESKLD